MAAHRRQATRNNPSSTQQESELPSFRFDDEEEESADAEPVLTQFGVDEDEDVNAYTLQLDNPLALLPDDDDDYALKEHMASQQQISQHEQEEFKESLEKEFDLCFNEANDNDDEAADEAPVNNNNNTYHCTQGALDAASVLVGGFDNGPCPGVVLRKHDEESMEEFYRHCGRTDFGPRDNNSTINDSNTAPPVHLDNDGALADQIATNLRKDGITGLTEEEREFVANVKQGKNSTKHKATQESLKHRFFERLAMCGGHVAPLATEQQPNPHDLSDEAPNDYRWFSVVGGAKNASKTKIINDSFVCVAMKWTCKTGPNKGRHCEASTFDKCMEQLTLIFQDDGVQCSYSKDFNKGGEFHGICKPQWDAIRKVDSKFGAGRNCARTGKELFTKFASPIRNGDIQPFENAEDSLLCVV